LLLFGTKDSMAIEVVATLITSLFYPQAHILLNADRYAPVIEKYGLVILVDTMCRFGTAASVLVAMRSIGRQPLPGFYIVLPVNCAAHLMPRNTAIASHSLLLVGRLQFRSLLMISVFPFFSATELSRCSVARTCFCCFSEQHHSRFPNGQ
jgi:hypothetical protein